MIRCTRLSALSGFLRIASGKLPYGMIPGVRDSGVTGVSIPLMTGRAPVQLLHAFLRGANVLERTGKSRYPLHGFDAPSAPRQIGEAHVFGEIKQGMERDLATELERTIRLVLSGQEPI